jgi:hypothetical protein
VSTVSTIFPRAAGISSRALIVALLIAAAVVALLPLLIARTRRLQTMRAGLAEVLAECRDRYAAAKTPDDTAEVDAWRPPFHQENRPGDPPCGPYRKRNLLGAARP